MRNRGLDRDQAAGELVAKLGVDLLTSDDRRGLWSHAADLDFAEFEWADCAWSEHRIDEHEVEREWSLVWHRAYEAVDAADFIPPRAYEPVEPVDFARNEERAAFEEWWRRTITAKETPGTGRRLVEQIRRRLAGEPEPENVEEIVSEPESVSENRIEARVLGFSALLQLPPPEWMIEGVLQVAPVSVLFGRGGSFKSFLALDWSLHAALGREWHGLAVTKETVLYVAAEGVGGLGARSQAWAEKYGVADVPDFFLYPGAVNFLDREQVVAVAEFARAHGVTFLVLDTLRRSMAGAEENSQKDAGLVLSHAGMIHEETSARSLIVHHANRQTGDFRGSSVIRDDADNVLKMERDLNTSPLTARLIGDKSKDTAELEGLVVLMEPVEFTDRSTGEPGSSLVVGAIEWTTQAVEAAKDVSTGAMLRALVDLCREPISPSKAADAAAKSAGLTRTRGREIVDEAIEEGLFEVEPSGKSKILVPSPALRWALAPREAS